MIDRFILVPHFILYLPILCPAFQFVLSRFCAERNRVPICTNYVEVR